MKREDPGNEIESPPLQSFLRNLEYKSKSGKKQQQQKIAILG